MFVVQLKLEGYCEWNCIPIQTFFLQIWVKQTVGNTNIYICIVYRAGIDIMYIPILTRVRYITRGVSARCWEGNGFDTQPKPRHN